MEEASGLFRQLITAAVIGVIFGLVARVVSSSRHPGIVTTIVIGFLGAAVGGWVSGVFGIAAGNVVLGLALPVIGAILMILVLKMVDVFA